MHQTQIMFLAILTLALYTICIDAMSVDGKRLFPESSLQCQSWGKTFPVPAGGHGHAGIAIAFV